MSGNTGTDLGSTGQPRLIGRPRLTAPQRRAAAGASAIVLVLVGWHFGWSPQLPAYLFFAGMGVWLSAVDLRHRLLPNNMVLPALAGGAVLLAVAAGPGNEWSALVRAVTGSAALFVLYLVLALISPAGMGMGDVKLAAVVGLFLAYQGWETLAVGAFAGFLLGALASLAVLAVRRGGLKSTIPFGPPMIAGALAAILLG